MLHDLKIQPHELDDVLEGRKTFEVLRDQGDVGIGDHLRLREWDPDAGSYLDRETVVEVTDVAELEDGRVVLAITAMPPEEEGPVS